MSFESFKKTCKEFGGSEVNIEYSPEEYNVETCLVDKKNEKAFKMLKQNCGYDKTVITIDYETNGENSGSVVICTEKIKNYKEVS